MKQELTPARAEKKEEDDADCDVQEAEADHINERVKQINIKHQQKPAFQ